MLITDLNLMHIRCYREDSKYQQCLWPPPRNSHLISWGYFTQVFLLCSLVRISTLGKRGFVDSLLTASLIIGIDSVRKKKCKQVALIGDFLENSPKTNIYHSHAQCLKVFISPYPLLSLAVFFAFFYVGDHFNTVSICIS